MKKYKITFLYHSDNRAEWSGTASHEIAALIAAFDSVEGISFKDGWTTEEGFNIKIELDKD